MAPFVGSAESLHAAHLGDLLTKAVVGGRQRQGLDIGMALGGVDAHIEDTEVQLAEVEKRVVDVLGADEVLNDIVWDTLGGGTSGGLAAAACLLGFLPTGQVFGGQCGVVAAEGAELRGCPAPVLEHLAGRLDEVPDCAGAVEAGVGGSRDKIVNAVAQLVEEGYDFVVLEQTGLLGAGLGEVAHQSSSGEASVAIRIDKALKSG